MIDVQHIKGQKIEGFFGFFDILGYSKLNENNDIDTLIEIFNNFILNIDEKAITLNYADKDQKYSMGKVKTLVFSDTIILYQEMPELLREIGPSFILKSCLLLRLAFEAGIPLRGAISYGKYYVHDRCFLGTPIIEAHEDEKAQIWSGAVLCKSAEEKYLTLSKERQETETINCRGIIINPVDWFSPFSGNLIFQYKVPYYKELCVGQDKEKHQKPVEKFALCWDDSLVDYAGLPDIPELNRGKNGPSIQQRIREKFAEHNKLKEPDERVVAKINNTAEFIVTLKFRQIRTRLEYIP